VESTHGIYRAKPMPIAHGGECLQRESSTTLLCIR
jgi:hypothetical protein